MIQAELFFAFLRIGAFSFGGGYAMIPLIAAEMDRYGWIDAKTFADIIAIAEMTPGPIAVNLATFVGFRAAGLLGSAIATFGVVLPSFLLIALVGTALRRLRGNPMKEAVFSGIRPAVVGLIASAALIVGEGTFLRRSADSAGTVPPAFMAAPALRLGSFDFDVASLLIAAGCFAVLLKSKVHPGVVILGAAALGVVAGVFFPGFGR